MDVINIGEYLNYKNCKCRKKLVDALIEECTENIDELKINENENENENNNKHKYNFFIMYTVLFSIFFVINIGIGI